MNVDVQRPPRPTRRSGSRRTPAVRSRRGTSPPSSAAAAQWAPRSGRSPPSRASHPRRSTRSAAAGGSWPTTSSAGSPTASASRGGTWVWRTTARPRRSCGATCPDADRATPTSTRSERSSRTPPRSPSAWRPGRPAALDGAPRGRDAAPRRVVARRDVDQIEAITSALRGLDYGHGGGACREAVVAQSRWVHQLLHADAARGRAAPAGARVRGPRQPRRLDLVRRRPLRRRPRVLRPRAHPGPSRRRRLARRQRALPRRAGCTCTRA